MHKILIHEIQAGAPLLFSGPAGGGKGYAARTFAGELLGDPKRCLSENHPDLIILRPQGKGALHPIEAIRELKAEIGRDPLEGERRVVIIEEAHRMGPPAANALLKTLEEPESEAQFILVTHRKGELLTTIRSRCRLLLFPPRSRAPKESVLIPLIGAAYPTLKRGVEEVVKELEGKKQQVMKGLRAVIPLQDLSAAARATKEAEIEGRGQIALLEEVESLLEELVPYGPAAVNEAYEAVLRSTKLTAAFETLLLSLQAPSRSPQQG
ncbi:MAG: AAA family ATPase [Parachlamydiales bacterium]